MNVDLHRPSFYKLLVGFSLELTYLWCTHSKMLPVLGVEHQELNQQDTVLPIGY